MSHSPLEMKAAAKRGGLKRLFPLRQRNGDVRRGADDPRAAVGVGLAPDQRFQNQKKFLGRHGATSLLSR
jgi:hypothetical protein